MDKWRNRFDEFYDLIKQPIFKFTARDPEQAHWAFTTFCQTLYHLGLDKNFLDNTSNKQKAPWEISNAAGFNKNFKISPRTMKYLGFDRTVGGTVTADKWKGNPKPRTRRFPETNSLVNWMGLPGIGARKVFKKLCGYGEGGTPLTINIMSTPGKEGRALCRDLEKTVSIMNCAPNVDRFELNISCPNTHRSRGGIDARTEYESQLKGMLDAVEGKIFRDKKLYVKVSPDLEERGVDEILRVCQDYDIAGFTIANTTTNHDPRYIPNSPGKGGASGDAVYEVSLRVQKLFAERTDKELIACGGVNSAAKAKEKCLIGNTNEIQIYTGIIFQGPKLLRELREAI